MTEPTATARVATGRAARYGKQLCSHLGRRADVTWDATTDTGRIEFDGGTASCLLTATDASLDLALTSPDEKLETFESVIGRHLVRFGAKDELECAWTRHDGSAGTTYRNEG